MLKMSKKSIMLVDDEADTREIVKIVLENAGYEVTTAVNGDDCLEKLKNQKPDLILMDVRMPGTPVKEIVPKIKGIKVAYFSSSRISGEERKELISLENVVAFFDKAMDNDELIAKIKKIIG